MKPIYVPKGAAKEYGDYALNIYTGCPHKCFYCYAPRVLHKHKEDFHKSVEPRKNIVEETKKQIERGNIHGKTIHLCFTCDPYPCGVDSTVTREIIKVIKDNDNNVQILTKNGKDAMRDFDLLDSNDWFGITYAGYSGNVYDATYIPIEEQGAGSPFLRLSALEKAHNIGIKTWVSAEPALDTENLIRCIRNINFVDLWKVGKLNYYQSLVDWGEFGRRVIDAMVSGGKNFYIKESLSQEIIKAKLQ